MHLTVFLLLNLSLHLSLQVLCRLKLVMVFLKVVFLEQILSDYSHISLSNVKFLSYHSHEPHKGAIKPASLRNIKTGQLWNSWWNQCMCNSRVTIMVTTLHNIECPPGSMWWVLCRLLWRSTVRWLCRPDSRSPSRCCFSPDRDCCSLQPTPCSSYCALRLEDTHTHTHTSSRELRWWHL